MKNLYIDDLDVFNALLNIQNFIHKTPIMSSETLNNMIGAEIFFKAESLQKTGAFKVRGALNHLLSLKKNNILPKKIVAYSTGNHGIAAAWCANKLNIQARIYLPEYTSKLKQQQASILGAEVIITQSRVEAEKRAYDDGKNDYYYLHPSDSNSTIAGAGTICFEALNQLDFVPDAIFASIGGGGLISGCYIAKEILNGQIQLIGSEPLVANDAAISKKTGEIFKFSSSPNTIADGLRTLGLSQRTYNFIKNIDSLYEIPEIEIEYWTIWLIHLLKINVETSCAINMASVIRWMKANKSKIKPKILVIISGGNIDPDIVGSIFDKNYLEINPLDFYKNILI